MSNIVPLLTKYIHNQDPWAPARTGDWATDNATGRHYADELIDRMVETEQPFLLGRIVKAMIGKGTYDGVEVGFFQRIAEHLTSLKAWFGFGGAYCFYLGLKAVTGHNCFRGTAYTVLGWGETCFTQATRMLVAALMP